MNRNTSARSSSVYKTGRRQRSLYKKNRRRGRSSKSGRSTDSASKKNKNKSSAFLRRALLVSVSALGAYLVYSVVEAENIAGLLEQILAVIRAALK